MNREIPPTAPSGGTPVFFFLFLLFLALKLTGYITWSWWWVTAPLWVPLIFAVGLFAVAGLMVWIDSLEGR